MSSSWSQKLESRLASLADTASQESIQAIAKWIGFNRKHGAALCAALKQALLSESLDRKTLCVKVIHQVLLLDHGGGNPVKWEKLADLRVQIGETVLVPCLPALMSSNTEWMETVNPLVKEWDNANVFGGPTLITQIRKLVATDAVEQTSTSAEPQDDEPRATAENERVVPKPEDSDSAPKMETKAVEADETPVAQQEEAKEVSKVDQPATENNETPPKRRGSIGEQTDFDFESTGIAYAKVAPKEFLEPCKAIATLQIARDLRSDAAVTLSSRLASIPDEVKKACQEHSEATELPKALADEFASTIPEDVLDADLDEARQNAALFLDIIKKQQEARKQLIQLLIQSRCQFGSEEAAEAFYSTEDVLERLKERKGLISDAMDLEGLDFVEDNTAEKKKDDAPLEPLTWYRPSDGESEPDSKRAKLE